MWGRSRFVKLAPDRPRQIDSVAQTVSFSRIWHPLIIRIIAEFPEVEGLVVSEGDSRAEKFVVRTTIGDIPMRILSSTHGQAVSAIGLRHFWERLLSSSLR